MKCYKSLPQGELFKKRAAPLRGNVAMTDSCFSVDFGSAVSRPALVRRAAPSVAVAEVLHVAVIGLIGLVGITGSSG